MIILLLGAEPRGATSEVLQKAAAVVQQKFLSLSLSVWPFLFKLNVGQLSLQR